MYGAIDDVRACALAILASAINGAATHVTVRRIGVSYFGKRTSSFWMGMPPFTAVGAWRVHVIFGGLPPTPQLPSTSKSVAYGRPSAARNDGPSAIWKWRANELHYGLPPRPPRPPRPPPFRGSSVSSPGRP